MPTPLEFIRSNRKRIIWIGGTLVLIAVLVVSWNIGMSQNGNTTSTTAFNIKLGGANSGIASGAVAMDAVRVSPIQPPSVMPVPAPTAGATAAEVDQKIIKTGNLSLTVAKAANAAARIESITTDLKGYVQSSSVSELPDGTHSGNITVRVPADQFETALTQIKATATVVKEENVSGQDVTEQYTDLQARLHNAQAQEATYLEVLKQAHTVEDILKVQEQLGIIRGDIESMQGQIKYLTNVTSYSTISVDVEEEPTINAPTKEFRPLDLIKQSVQTLIDAFQALAAGLIKLLIIGGGLLLPLALIVWIIYLIAKTLAKKRNRG
jgi:conjugal transfer/entry exclusion protein